MLPKQLSLPENKKIFLYIALLVIVLALYFGLIYLLKYLGFPSSEEIIAFTQKYYETYGYSVVLVGALAEGALLINWYLPFFKFSLYSLISIVLWNSLWTVLFYYFGSILIKHVNLLIIGGGIFVYFMFVKSFKESKVNIP